MLVKVKGHLCQGSRWEDVLSGRIKYNDMHGSPRSMGIEPVSMDVVVLPSELEVGRFYYLKSKELDRIHVAECKADGERLYFFNHRLWAYEGNAQVFKHFHIVGPVPEIDFNEFI
jgi:hypothetical protein